MSPGARAAGVALVAFAAPFAALAHVVGGEVESRRALDPAAEIARGAHGSAPVWFVWRAPARGGRTIGCFSNWGPGGVGRCGCSLAERSGNWGSTDRDAGGGGALEIYVEVRGGRIDDLVLASERCPVRAEGERVVVLDGVEARRGVDFLAGLARRDGGTKGSRANESVADRALAALAHHDAVAVPAAGEAISDIARTARDEERRGQALFWLSQTGDARAARWIREAIAGDPEEEVREQAVFALSQLDDATDQLLALIRESRDREVKRKALFWLGQSDDPRALAEIERVLLR